MLLTSQAPLNPKPCPWHHNLNLSSLQKHLYSLGSFLESHIHSTFSFVVNRISCRRLSSSLFCFFIFLKIQRYYSSLALAHHFSSLINEIINKRYVMLWLELNPLLIKVVETLHLYGKRSWNLYKSKYLKNPYIKIFFQFNLFTQNYNILILLF